MCVCVCVGLPVSVCNPSLHGDGAIICVEVSLMGLGLILVLWTLLVLVCFCHYGLWKVHIHFLFLCCPANEIVRPGSTRPHSKLLYFLLRDHVCFILICLNILWASEVTFRLICTTSQQFLLISMGLMCPFILQRARRTSHCHVVFFCFP